MASTEVVEKETTFFAELRRAIFTRTPFKHIWATTAILFNLIRFPLWLIYYLPRSTRGHPTWSMSQAIKVRIFKEALSHISYVEAVTPRSLEPGKEGDRWVVIRPAEKEMCMGPLTSDSTIVPKAIGATWYPAALTKGAAQGDVLLHFHGGGYVIGSGRTADAGFPAKVVLKETNITHVLAPNYRLACNSGCRFPAQLQDAVSSYKYLTHELGVPANKIVFSGDSAGANLALALMRYLAEYGEKIGLEAPKAAWLWSPWVDPIHSYRSLTHYDQLPNAQSDYVPNIFGTYGARSLAPDPATSSLTVASPYISNSNAPFRTVPCFVQLGGCEALSFEIMDLVKALRDVEGNQVEVYVDEYAPHDIFTAGDKLGFVKELTAGIRAAGRWTDGLKASDQ